MTFSKLRALCAAMLLALIIAPHSAFAQAVQVPPGKVCFNAVTGISGSIQTLTGLDGGTAGTNGVYTNVPLTGGSGKNATATITVVGISVNSVIIQNPGTQYAVGDVLSANSSTIGGTVAFSIVVGSTQIASNLAGGSVGMYYPGTLNFKQTWQNANESTQNTNPIILDSNGCAIIYGVGTYRQILYDNLGNIVWDQPTSVAPTNPYWAGLSTGTSNAIVLIDGQFSAIDGQSIQFLAANTNTGPATITVNGYTYSVLKNSASGPVALSGGEIIANNIEDVTYSSTLGAFVLTSPIYQTSALAYAYGQARFVAQSASTVALIPYGGNLITISGTNYAIPSGGVAANINTCYVNGVAGQTLSASMLYYVYIWNNAGTLTLNFSTTGHITDTVTGNVGVEVMSGNDHYSLIGMVYPTAGPNLSYTGAYQLVSSWFNRVTKTANANFTTTRTTTSATPVEVNTEIRTFLLTWSDAAYIDARISSTSPGGGGITTFIGIDGTSQPWSVSAESVTGTGGNSLFPISVNGIASGLAEGYHYVTLFGDIPGGTATWNAETYLNASSSE